MVKKKSQAASAEKLLGLERQNKAYDKIVRDKESGSQENFFQLSPGAKRI